MSVFFFFFYFRETPFYVTVRARAALKIDPHTHTAAILLMSTCIDMLHNNTTNRHNWLKAANALVCGERSIVSQPSSQAARQGGRQADRGGCPGLLSPFPHSPSLDSGDLGSGPWARLGLRLLMPMRWCSSKGVRSTPALQPVGTSPLPTAGAVVVTSPARTQDLQGQGKAGQCVCVCVCAVGVSSLARSA